MSGTDFRKNCYPWYIGRVVRGGEGVAVASWWTAQALVCLATCLNHSRSLCPSSDLKVLCFVHMCRQRVSKVWLRGTKGTVIFYSRYCDIWYFKTKRTLKCLCRDACHLLHVVSFCTWCLGWFSSLVPPHLCQFKMSMRYYKVVSTLSL